MLPDIVQMCNIILKIVKIYFYFFSYPIPIENYLYFADFLQSLFL
jgi:hypothetical protein